MVELINHGVYLLDGKTVADSAALSPDEARENTIAYGILRAHDVDGSKGNKLRIRFDAMASHDITYVGIIQTARASGLDTFPIPYAMTNCHNSLCAVGGTINEDDTSSASAQRRSTVESMSLQTRQLSTSTSGKNSPAADVWSSVLTLTRVTARWAAWVWAKAAANS